MKARVVWSLLTETFVEWYEDRAPRLGAALAYYTVFALSPGLILIIALAGLVLGKEAAQGQIISQVQDLAGEAGAQAVRAAIESGRNAGGSVLATSLGISTLLFGLWGVFGELQDALNTIWGVKSKPGRGIIGVIKQRFWSFTMVVGIGFLLLVSLAASAWLAAFGKVFSRLLPLPAAMMETTNALLSFVVITFMFAVIYKLLPDVNLAWRNVWTGAAVTAVLFTIGKTLIGLYLGRSTVASVYGAAGSLIVILLWVYYSAQVVFLGAEFTKVYSRRFYPVRRLAPVERRNGRRTGTMQVLLVVVAILSASCARVPSHFALPELAAEEPSFLPTVEAYTSAAHGGNAARVLLNGDQIFPAQLEAIRAARQTISYAQYFYEEGAIGLEIVEALAERCRAGIRAHVLLDGFGAVLMPAAYAETMRQAGCKVATFRPLRPWSVLAAVGLRRDNKRNHRRILVVDGQIGFTGGSGVSPKWLGDGRTEGHWRDTDVRIEGPIVARLQGAFVENWLEATGDVLGGEAYFPPLPRRGSVSAQIVPSSPTGGSFSMYTMFLLAMSSARRSIYITNPYFLPDERMMRVLTEAPDRGVRVVVLLPGAIDNNIVRQASRSTFGTLLHAGIELYEYQAGLLHAKTMTIDGMWATIGSTNLDTRSFALNEELNAVMYGTEVAGQLDQHFADDLRYARRIDYRQWGRRGVLPRLLELFSVPFREQL